MNARCGGTLRIVQFNWPFYAGAVALAAVAAASAAAMPRAPWLQILQVAAAGAAFWMAASLCASWMVYDHSALMGAAWIPAALGFRPRSWIVIAAGFDEMTPALRRVLAGSDGRAFDIYDPVTMTEPSIARARAWAGTEVERVDARQLPVPDRSVEAAVLPLSAHEFRTHRRRCDLFAEVNRVLAPDGRVVVVEHLRDVANFLAFGPGFLHFHSRRAWLRCFTGGGLAVREEFAMTPFVRVFVLGRLP